MIVSAPSPNFDTRDPTAEIDMLVLHYTGMRSRDAALARLCDPLAKVSAHYLIDEAGQVFQLVEEDKRAWHAGVSGWAGCKDINGCSLGIELVNPGHEFGYHAFPARQMQALVTLAADLVARYAIARSRVLGHSDVAPLRKCDPGELFDWQMLARAGVGLWPEDPVQKQLETLDAEALARFGYMWDGADPAAFAAVVRAFQRHWRPAHITGVGDPETASMLAVLLHEISKH